MKILIYSFICFSLVGCSSLDAKGRCYFAEMPQRYLVNEKGQNINLNGELSLAKVENPYYLDYLKCYGEPVVEQGTLQGEIANVLKNQYTVNGVQYDLVGQRTFKKNGGFVSSTFEAKSNATFLVQEIFYYPDTSGFKQRFFEDINRTEGQYSKATSDGVEYFIGKNNHMGYIIYVVKPIFDSNISVVQWASQQPIDQKSIAQLVKDLNQI